MLWKKNVDEKALANLMNNYFVNITADLDLKQNSENLVYNIK